MRDMETVAIAVSKAVFWVMLICAVILGVSGDGLDAMLCALGAAFMWCFDGYYRLKKRIDELEERN